MKIKYKTKVDDPDYRYGDLNRKSWMYKEGKGRIITFLTVGETIKAIIETDDKKIMEMYLKDLVVL